MSRVLSKKEIWAMSRRNRARAILDGRIDGSRKQKAQARKHLRKLRIQASGRSGSKRRS